ncbi:MAG: IS3 family transposase [Actinomycetia bacterium]|nr:IS3 family transposase [Actinomycetes bacterium]
MRYGFIDQERAHHAVSRLTRALGVTRAAYYAYKRRGPSARRIHDDALKDWIEYFFEQSRRIYGAPRIHADLTLGLGVAVGRKRVARLMRELDLTGVSKSRNKRPAPKLPPECEAAPDLVRRVFAADAPNRLWSADITYLRTHEGWLYLALVMDVCSRRIVGWSMAATLHAEIVVDAVVMALTRREPPPGLIHHSDRGSQYRSLLFGRTLAGSGIAASMGSRGDAYDNAVTESIMSTIKAELVEREVFGSKDLARLAVFDYIECFYNPQRRHSTLGYLSPIEFEEKMWSAA